MYFHRLAAWCRHAFILVSIILYCLWQKRKNIYLYLYIHIHTNCLLYFIAASVGQYPPSPRKRGQAGVAASQALRKRRNLCCR